VDTEFVGSGEGENDLRAGLGARKEELTVVRVQGIHTQVHTGLCSGRAGLPVVHEQGCTGLHGEGGALGHALGLGVGGGQGLSRIVEVLVDLVEDVVAVHASHLVGILEGEVLIVVGHVAEERNQVGVERSPEELGLTGILPDLGVGQVVLCLVDALDDGVGTGDSLVVACPVLGAFAPGRGYRAGEPVVALGTLVPVVGPAVCGPEAPCLRVPHHGRVEGIEGELEFLRRRVPVFA
jgi:hypothetical protein